MKIIRPWLPAAVILLIGCTPEAPAQSETNYLGEGTVATVNGKPVHESVFRAYALGRTQMNADELNEEQREAVLDEVVQLYVLADSAETAGLQKERNIAAQLEIQRLNLLARSQISRYQEQNPITELELREAYDANVEELSGPQYKALHILVNEQAEAEAIIAALDGGADFATQAKEKSTGPSGPNGGDLGWFEAGTMVPPFAEAVRGMTKGTYTKTPVQTRFGYHVILLEDVKEGEAPGLDAVRDKLTNTAIQQKIQTYVEGLKEAATITMTAAKEETTPAPAE